MGADDSLFKEESIYAEEVTTAQANLDKLKAGDADGADIRQAVSMCATRSGRAGGYEGFHLIRCSCTRTKGDKSRKTVPARSLSPQALLSRKIIAIIPITSDCRARADGQERIVADSQQMIPRTRKQLEEAFVGLQDLVAALAEDKAVAGSQEYGDAVAIVEQVEKAWANE